MGLIDNKKMFFVTIGLLLTLSGFPVSGVPMTPPTFAPEPMPEPTPPAPPAQVDLPQPQPAPSSSAQYPDSPPVQTQPQAPVQGQPEMQAPVQTQPENQGPVQAQPEPTPAPVQPEPTAPVQEVAKHPEVARNSDHPEAPSVGTDSKNQELLQALAERPGSVLIINGKRPANADPNGPTGVRAVRFDGELIHRYVEIGHNFVSDASPTQRYSDTNENFPANVTSAVIGPNKQLYLFRGDKHCIRPLYASSQHEGCSQWVDNRELFGCGSSYNSDEYLCSQPEVHGVSSNKADPTGQTKFIYRDHLRWILYLNGDHAPTIAIDSVYKPNVNYDVHPNNVAHVEGHHDQDHSKHWEGPPPHGHDAGAHGHDAGAHGHDAGAHGHHAGAQGHDAGAQGHDAGAQGQDAGAHPTQEDQGGLTMGAPDEEPAPGGNTTAPTGALPFGAYRPVGAPEGGAHTSVAAESVDHKPVGAPEVATQTTPVAAQTTPVAAQPTPVAAQPTPAVAQPVG